MESTEGKPLTVERISAASFGQKQLDQHLSQAGQDSL
jgi:hypothetical protein